MMWTIWFQDGQGRELISSKEELKTMASRFSFNADDVLRNGGVDLVDADGDIIGGVFEEEEAEEEADWFLNDIPWEDYYNDGKGA
jgi:hypothetical protein